MKGANLSIHLSLAHRHSLRSVFACLAVILGFWSDGGPDQLAAHAQSATFSLAYVGSASAQRMAFPAQFGIGYLFRTSGYELSWTSSGLNAIVTAPRVAHGYALKGEYLVLWVLPTEPSGTYRVRLQTQDGRAAEATFAHPVQPSTADPALQPTPTRLASPNSIQDTAALAAVVTQAGDVADAVTWLNRERQRTEVSPVILDPTLSNDAAAHARYLVLNAGNSALEGLNAHDEVASLPGATPRGRVAAQSSVLYEGWTVQRDKPLTVALDGVQQLMTVPLHRNGLLAPDLRRIGIGTDQSDDGTRIQYAAAIDVDRGIDYTVPLTTRPVVYPYPGQRDADLWFGAEVPDARDATPDGTRTPAFAITVEPSCGVLGAPSRAELRDESGRVVPVALVPPGTVLSAVGGLGLVRQVILFPREPLDSGTTYRVLVSVTCDGKNNDLDWSFTTAGIRTPKVARGEFEIRVAESLSFDQATDLTRLLDAARPYVISDRPVPPVALVIAREAMLPSDAWQRVARWKGTTVNGRSLDLKVKMADGGLMDPRLLEPLLTAATGVSDYREGPQFASAYIVNQPNSYQWGTPTAPPIVVDGAWVLQFSSGTTLKWLPTASSAEIVPAATVEVMPLPPVEETGIGDGEN